MPKWESFLASFSERWQPGEHVFIYGETGAGKTDLAFRLLNTRPFGVAFITKPRDPIFRRSITHGYKRAHAWPPRVVNARNAHHFLLSAKPGKSMQEEIAHQQELFPDAFDDIYQDGGWSVLIDETIHLSGPLHMSSRLESFAYLARSNALTGIYCSQRPRRIPVVIPQSCKYAFLARSRRVEDTAVLSELGMDRRELKARLDALNSRHDFLFVDSITGDVEVVNSHD